MSTAEQEAYNGLLDQIKAAVRKHNAALEYVSREPLANATALKFEAPTCSIDLTGLNAYLNQMFSTRVRLQWDNFDGNTQYLSVLVPRRVQWRCLERFTPVQLCTIGAAVVIGAATLLGSGLLVRYLVYPH